MLYLINVQSTLKQWLNDNPGPRIDPFTSHAQIYVTSNVADSEKPSPSLGTNSTSSIPRETWRHVCISFLLLFQIRYKSS